MGRGFVTELEVLQWAEQICYRDQRDMTSEMLKQVIAGREDFYRDRPILLDAG